MAVNRNIVAKKAGVSPAVVSYVLNNSNYVSEQKRKAVLDAIRELGYNPNMIARSMKTRKSYCFAIVADDIRNEMFAEFLYYMEKFSFDIGYTITLCSSRYDDSFIRALISRQFDGIFMTSNGFSSEQLNEIVDANIAMVLFKSRTYSNLSEKIVVLNIDFQKSVVLAMEHLYSLGHRRIAFIPPYLYKAHDLKDNGLRSIAYLESLKRFNLGEDPALYCTNMDSYENICRWAYELVIKTHAEKNPVTSFVVSNDTVAAMVQKTLQNGGFKIPRDISIVGLDNTLSSYITTPSITSVNTPKKEFAMAIIDKLINIVNGQEVKSECFDVNLVIKESTAPPRA